MKKGSKFILNTMLVLFLLLTSLGMVVAEEPTTISDDNINVVVNQQYDDESNKEVLTLTVSKENSAAELKGLILPDGSSVVEETGVYTYEVTENGTNVFKVLYSVSQEQEDGSFKDIDMEKEVSVETTSIVGMSIMMAPVVNGDLTVEIASYDETAGWTVGLPYDVTIDIDYSNITSAKEVEIILPAGMTFASYSVLPDTVNPGAPGKVLADDSTLKPAITSITVPTADPNAANSYYGTLKYTFVEGNYPKISFTITVKPDANLMYQNFTITDAITVNAYGDSGLIGTFSTDVKVVGVNNTTVFENGYLAASQGTVALADTAVQTVPNIGITSGYPFLKQVDYYVPYPDGAVYVRTVQNGVTLIDNDTVTNTLHLRKYNVVADYSSSSMLGLQFTTDQLAEGLHVADEVITIDITYYDDTTATFTSTEKVKFNVVDETPNKVSIVVNDGSRMNYYAIHDDYESASVRYFLKNETINPLTDQKLHIISDGVYQISTVVFPSNLAVSNVKYKTNVNTEWTTATVYSTGSYTYTISTANEGLSPGVYITEVIADLPTIPVGYNSATLDGNLINQSVTPAIYGKHKGTAETGYVTVETYSEDEHGVVDPLSNTSKTVEVYYGGDLNAIAATNVPTFRTNGPIADDIEISAGDKKTVTLNIGNTFYNTGSALSGISGGGWILKVVDGVSYTNFKVTKDGSDIDFTSIGPIEINGSYYHIIETDETTGRMFNGQTEANLEFTFDIVTAKNASGSYNLTDIIWAFSDGVRITNHTYNSIVDTQDLNQNGKTDDYIFPYGRSQNGNVTRTLSITPKKELLVDTYIVPDGGLRQAAYDGTDATAVGFTPGTEGDYTVVITNNRNDAVDSIAVYLPVPKTGTNISTDFQSAAYKWDMRVTGSYDISVSLNGVPAPAKESNYEVYYTTGLDGSSVLYPISEYKTDGQTGTSSISWTQSASAAVQMIKIVSTQPIQPGEEITVTFKYVAAETVTSVETSPEKLGATNDFRPYFYFDGGTAAWNNGTKVGAILQNGVIEGTLFLDKDLDGTFSVGDTKLSGYEIVLYNSSNAEVAKVNTAADGTYSFTGLAGGSYRVDFTSIYDDYKYFTDQGKQTTVVMGSVVPQTGANTGLALNVDPTAASAKEINVGVMDYDPVTDLKVSATSGVTVKEPNGQYAGSDLSANMTATNTTANWDSVRASSGHTTYTVDKPAVADIDTSGNIIGVADSSTIANRTATATVTITDKFGNTKTATTSVTVVSNKIPTITFAEAPLVIQKGGTYTAMSGVTAHDPEKGALTGSALEVVTAKSDTVNVNVAGVYNVVYKATDVDGNYVEANRVVIVSDGSETIIGDYVIYANSFTVKASAVNTSDLGADILTRSAAEAYNTKTGEEATMIVNAAGGYTNTAGTYTIELGISEDVSGTAVVTIYAIVTAEDEEVVINDKYAITAYPVEIGKDTARTITDAELISLTKAQAIKLADGSAAEVVVKSHNVAATPGAYTVTFAVKNEAEPTLTVAVTVKDYSVVTDGDMYNIGANHITLKLADVKSGLTNAQLITLTGAKAWKQDDPGQSAAVSVSAKTVDTTKVGNYTVTFQVDSEPTTKVTVNVKIVDADNVVDGEFYAISANDFSISIKDIAAMGDAVIITKSGAKAWSKADYSAATVVVTDRSNLRNKAGVYVVTLAVSEEPSLKANIKITVVDEDIVVDGDAYSISANNFSVTVNDVTAGLSDNDLITLGGAKAWKRNDLAATTAVSVANNTLDVVPGVYAVTYQVAAETATKITVNVRVVDNDHVVDGKEYTLAASNFRVTLTEAQTLADADIIAKAEAEAWERLGSGAGTVKIKTNSIDASQTGTYAVVFQVAEETSLTLSIQVEVVDSYYEIIADDFTISLSELRNSVDNGTLEQIVVQKANAEGWYRHSHDADVQLDVRVHTDDLVTVNGAHRLSVTLYLLNPRTRDITQAIHTDTITVTVIVPSTATSPGVSPATGVDNTATLYSSIALAIGSLVAILYLGKRKKEA